MSSPANAVSVVIPCFNVASVLPRQLEGLLPQLRGVDEVLLVNNRSTDTTADLIASLAASHPNVRGVDASGRPGANHARNIGVLAARHDLVLLCDADDQVHPGWVEAFRIALAHCPVVGGTAVPVDGNGKQVGEERSLMHIFDDRPYSLSGCMAFRRDLFVRIGGFDESFFGGHDEADFGWRAAEAGAEICHTPGARISYVQRSTPGLSFRQHRSYARSAIQLWVRHQDTIRPGAISFKGAVRNLLRCAPVGLKVVQRRADRQEAEAWGWAVGTVEGHLRYRLLAKPPKPVLLKADIHRHPSL